MATKTPSVMERNINTVIDVFHQHSRKGGNPDTLNQQEFKKLVETDLATFLKVRLGLVREESALSTQSGRQPHPPPEAVEFCH